jgi:hypothetical protein
MNSLIGDARRKFHHSLLQSILSINDKGIASNADKDSAISVSIARGVAEKLGSKVDGLRLAGQTSGNQFERHCEVFLKETFPLLNHLRPGSWQIHCVGARSRAEITRYEQYAHLAVLDNFARENPSLRVALGSDYLIAPDLVIARQTEPDERINEPFPVIDNEIAQNA